MKTKFNKDSRNAIIAMLLGDGSINKNNGFRMTHCSKQVDYLKWKVDILNSYGIKNSGVNSYVSTKGFKIGEQYYYTRINTIPFIKVLRRVVYKNKKCIANRKLLNRLTPQGIAIWYMDDGHINHRKKVGFYIKLSTCLSKSENQIIIDYFKEVWDISFYQFSEGKGTYSLCCGTFEGIKFLNLVKTYVKQIPSMEYKITYNIKDRSRSISRVEQLEMGNTQKLGEDIVWSSLKDEAQLAKA